MSEIEEFDKSKTFALDVFTKRKVYESRFKFENTSKSDVIMIGLQHREENSMVILMEKSKQFL